MKITNILLTLYSYYKEKDGYYAYFSSIWMISLLYSFTIILILILFSIFLEKNLLISKLMIVFLMISVFGINYLVYKDAENLEKLIKKKNFKYKPKSAKLILFSLFILIIAMVIVANIGHAVLFK